MKACSYCGHEGRDYSKKRNLGAYHPVKLYIDNILDWVCTDCKGQYETLRLGQYIKRGKTLKEARHSLAMSGAKIWTRI